VFPQCLCKTEPINLGVFKELPLNGNQVQQVSEESLNFERAPLKLQRAIKLPPTKTRERERERERERRGWRGWGDDAACEKKRGSLSFWAEVLMDRKKIFRHSTTSEFKSLWAA